MTINKNKQLTSNMENSFKFNQHLKFIYLILLMNKTKYRIKMRYHQFRFKFNQLQMFNNKIPKNNNNLKVLNKFNPFQNNQIFQQFIGNLKWLKEIIK